MKSQNITSEFSRHEVFIPPPPPPHQSHQFYENNEMSSQTIYVFLSRYFCSEQGKNQVSQYRLNCKKCSTTHITSVIDSEGANAGGKWQISTDNKYKGINVFIPSQMQCIGIQFKKFVTCEIFTDLLLKTTILSTLPHPSIKGRWLWEGQKRSTK